MHRPLAPLGLLALCASSLLAQKPPALPPNREPVPTMSVVHRVDFTGLKDFSQTIPAGVPTVLDLPADLPVGKPTLGQLEPIDQGTPLKVTATVPRNAQDGVVFSTANIGGKPALSFASQKAPGMSLNFRVANLQPGAAYAASVLMSAQADPRAEAARLRVSGQGLAPIELTSPTTTPAAPRVRQLLIPFVAPRDGRVSIDLINPRAGDPLHVRSLDIRTHPTGRPIPLAQDLPKPGNRFDFSTVKWTDLHVAVDHPAASDKNDGSPDHPLKTLAAALQLAIPLLGEGTPVRILLAPGIYREGGAFGVKNAANPLLLDTKELGAATPETPLAIIGSEPGKVILSGADPLTGWQLADKERNLWRAPWPHNWGPTDRGFYPITNPLVQRSEVLIVDGKILPQRLLEDVKYERGAFIDFGPGQSRNVAGRWTLGKYLGPDILQPGEFGVAEFGPGDTSRGMTSDGHPDPNTIWLRLPPASPPTPPKSKSPSATGASASTAKTSSGCATSFSSTTSTTASS